MEKLLFSFILILSIQAQSRSQQFPESNVDLSPDQCGTVVVQTPNLLGEIESTKEMKICHDQEFRTAISSDCKNDLCRLISMAKTQKEPLTYSSRGTPGAWLCKKLGGTSAMVFMKSSEQPKEKPGTKVHVCQLASEIVSVDYLLSKMPAIKK